MNANDPTPDASDYSTPEDETAPVIAYAAWDDESGIVTSLVPDRASAEADLVWLLGEWARDNIAPDNTRVREFHIHDDGAEVTTDPADDCPICGTTTGRVPA